jgi:salicylate hydroxylase
MAPCFIIQEFNFLLVKAIPGHQWPVKGKVTQKITHEEMMTEFPGVDQRFNALLAKANPVRWGLFHHIATTSYYRDRICILGDSAHASMPFQAAGAAQGLEDALVLSNVLAELAKSPAGGATRGAGPGGEDQTREIRAGLRAYDAVRRPRAQEQLEKAYEVGRLIYFQHEQAGNNVEKILSRLQGGWFNWLWFHDLQEDVDKALDMMRTELQKSAFPLPRLT